MRTFAIALLGAAAAGVHVQLPLPPIPVTVPGGLPGTPPLPIPISDLPIPTELPVGKRQGGLLNGIPGIGPLIGGLFPHPPPLPIPTGVSTTGLPTGIPPVPVSVPPTPELPGGLPLPPLPLGTRDPEEVGSEIEERQGTANIGPVDVVSVLGIAGNVAGGLADARGGLIGLIPGSKEKRQLPGLDGLDPTDILGDLDLPLDIKERQESDSELPEDLELPDLPTDLETPDLELGDLPGAEDLPLDPTSDDSTNARATITDAAVLPDVTPLLDVERDCDSLYGEERERCYRRRGWRTSTVLVTNVITISSCPATHTDCPYTRHPVTTVTILTSTTVCPITTSTSTTSTDEPTSTHEGTSTDTCTDEPTSTTDCESTETTTSCTDTGTPTSTADPTTTTDCTTLTTSTCDGRYCHHTKTCTGGGCGYPTTTDGGGQTGYPTSYYQANAAATGVGMVGGLLMGAVVALL